MDTNKAEDQGNRVTLDAEAAWKDAIPLVEKIWEGVFHTTDRMLKVHHAFGFSEFEKQMNPKLENVIKALNVLETILDAMYGSGILDHDDARLVLNSKQQIILVQRVAEALRGNSEADYTAAMENMAKQAVF